MVIREATIEDAAEIARVQVDTWRTTYRGIVPQDFLDAMDYDVRTRSWREQLATPGLRIYVAEMNRTIGGFVSGGRLREGLQEFDGEIFAIYVDADAQRCGCGKALLRQLAEGLLQDGLTSAVVWVLEENPACGFYARLGGERLSQKMITIGGSDLVEAAYGFKSLRLLVDASQ